MNRLAEITKAFDDGEFDASVYLENVIAVLHDAFDKRDMQFVAQLADKLR